MMTIQVGNTRYAVSLNDNATTQALTQKLPMTSKMDELNGNENFIIFWRLCQRTPNESAESKPGM
nr:cyclophilin-like fold protein [Trichococcus flocculiformis]